LGVDSPAFPEESQDSKPLPLAAPMVISQDDDEEAIKAEP